MPEEERLSAVAKRRRLNGNVAHIVDSPSLKTRAHSPKRIPVEVTAIASQAVSVTTESSDQDFNTFTTLVDYDVVDFSNFREIEHLGDRAIKVRLSKGSKCVISGRYGLWIKEGVIEMLGAKLQASVNVHNVFSSLLFDVPPITALTNSVEFEIYSCSDETPFSYTYDTFEWTSQHSEQPLQASFLVHGYSIPKDKELIPSVREFDGSVMADAAYRASHSKQMTDNKKFSSILFCGRQSNGTAMLITSLINHVMTSRHDTPVLHAKQSVVLLDLDIDTPLFGPPGSVSLVHIYSPILGAPFTHPGAFNSASQAPPFQILKLQYVDRTAYAAPIRQQLDLMIMFLEYTRQLRVKNFTLVIRANNWIETMDPYHIATVTKQFAFDLVICSGSDTGPNTAQLRDIVHTQSGTDAFLNVSHSPSKDLALHAQHQVLIQSYFQFRGYHHGCPRWDTLPLEFDRRHSLCLSYGVESTLVPRISRISMPGMSMTQGDIVDALESCIVAIVLQDSGVAGDRHSAEVHNVRNGTTSYDQVPKTRHMNDAECIGLGIIAGFDRKESKICLLTPVLADLFGYYNNQGRDIDLVVLKPDLEGRFDTGWLQPEGETMMARRKSAKFVYRHSLDVNSK